jgi:type II secretory pathway component PulF
VIGTILYVAAVAGLVLLSQVAFLSDHQRAWSGTHRASEGSYAALWGSFSLLYSVGEHREEIFRKLAKSATTKEARLGFTRMAQLVREGREIDQAIAVARFPLYIVNPVIAGQRSASLVETTRSSTKNSSIWTYSAPRSSSTYS